MKDIAESGRDFKSQSKKCVSLFDAVVGTETTQTRDDVAERLQGLLGKINEYDRSLTSGPALGLGQRSPYAMQLKFPVIDFILKHAAADEDHETWRLAGKVAGASYKGVQLAGSEDFSDDRIRYDVSREIWNIVMDMWPKERDDDFDAYMCRPLEEGIEEGIVSPRTDLNAIVEAARTEVEAARRERGAHVLSGPILGASKDQDVLWPEKLGNRAHPKSPANVRAYLAFHGIDFRWNAHTREVHITGLPGKDRVDDNLVSDLALGMNDYGCDVPLDFFHREIGRIARQNAFNPVFEYFARHQAGWDKKERLEFLFIDYAGAEDTPLNRAIGKAFGVTFVRRSRSPGCPLFGFPILEGYEGGEGKSTFAQTLAGDLGFTDSLPVGAPPKQVIEEMRGIALAELSEMVGLTDKGNEQVKAMVTRREDVARTAYGRTASAVPRAFCFIGTTNSPAYLKERGGLRRYWPIKVGVMDIEALKSDRDQLLGEAAALEARGEPNNIPEELWDAARKEQETRVISDPVEDAIEDAISSVKEGFVPNSALQAALEHRNLDWERASRCGAVARVMAKSGFVSRRLRKPGTDLRSKGFLRGSVSAANWLRFSPGSGLTLDKATIAADNRSNKVVPIRQRKAS